MQILDDDGLAAPGEIIRPNDIYINKQSPIDTRSKVSSPAGLEDKSVLFLSDGMFTYSDGGNEAYLVINIQVLQAQQTNI